jgi:hypothetical protein
MSRCRPMNAPILLWAWNYTAGSQFSTTLCCPLVHCAGRRPGAL